jgi:hypothetical protein
LAGFYKHCAPTELGSSVGRVNAASSFLGNFVFFALLFLAGRAPSSALAQGFFAESPMLLVAKVKGRNF